MRTISAERAHATRGGGLAWRKWQVAHTTVHRRGQRTHLGRRREAAQLAVEAVSEARLLRREADGAVGAVEDDGRADTRAEDDAAIDALGDLHLLARVEHADRALLTALDLHVDALAGPAREARAGRLEVGGARH